MTYLITITSSSRWAEPDNVWCTSQEAELEKNIRRCAEEHLEEDECIIQVWELTPVEVVSVAFEIRNLPEKDRK